MKFSELSKELNEHFKTSKTSNVNTNLSSSSSNDSPYVTDESDFSNLDFLNESVELSDIELKTLNNDTHTNDETSVIPDKPTKPSLIPSTVT